MHDLIMTLRNPMQPRDLLPVYIKSNGTELATDWLVALRNEIQRSSHIEKNYCWHGWPNTPRTLMFLCGLLNIHIGRINAADIGYVPIDYVACDLVFADNEIDHGIMNQVHNHFEHLQGTVGALSPYYIKAEPKVKYSIRQLNNICHEIETLCVTMNRANTQPEWIRPSQITTFFNAQRHRLNREHRKGFAANSYDRRFGHVYMHWTQIGKTLMEVFRDEHAPTVDQATCDAITHLEYYSGEFDIEWGRDITFQEHAWHRDQVQAFHAWLLREGYDPADPALSLGYLELAHVDLDRSFGTSDPQKIWDLVGQHLDIYSLRVGNDVAVYDYCWTSDDYEQQQIAQLMPGYLSHA